MGQFIEFTGATRSGRNRVLATVSALAITALMAPLAHAQDAPKPAQVDEIVVTGSRIVSPFKAPTPLTVVDTAALQAAPQSNVAQQLITMPVFSGSSTTANNGNGVSAASSGVSLLNLRNMGTTRTLILIDGQRSVGSVLTGGVDVNTVPQQLIKRVEVVTGGASAVYGSDAVSGVVNFILDREYVGIKGEVSAGLTSYADDKNAKVSISGGFKFGGDRGHVLLSAEHVEKDGIVNGTNGRNWLYDSPGFILNPTYTATNGQPNRLMRLHVGISNATFGGVIASGPLKGTAFGPGGVPYQLNQGTELIGAVNFVGGD
jgi:outer membrane cobalamin receptor